MRIRAFLLAGLLALPLPAAAVTPENFLVGSARDLLMLCSAAPSDPLHREAVHFCHGYLVGAYQYMRAVTSGPGSVQLVCFGDPRPSRNQDRKRTRLNSSHKCESRMPSSA